MCQEVKVISKTGLQDIKLDEDSDEYEIWIGKGKQRLVDPPGVPEKLQRITRNTNQFRREAICDLRKNEDGRKEKIKSENKIH